MNGLLLASEPKSKDINFKSEKIQDIESKELDPKYDFFQSLMENMLQEFPDNPKRALLIAKITDLPSDLQQKEQILSHFSGEKLFTDHHIDKVSIETLIDIATLLKSHPQAPLDFPTDSKALKTALLDLNVQKELKSAKTVGDLLKIAEQSGIKIKNFEFFKEESALDNSAKAMVKKINSAEIFTLMTEQKSRPDVSLQHAKPHAKHTAGMIKEILEKSDVSKMHADKTSPAASKPADTHSTLAQSVQEKASVVQQTQIKTTTDTPKNANPAKTGTLHQSFHKNINSSHADTPSTPAPSLQEKASSVQQTQITATSVKTVKKPATASKPEEKQLATSTLNAISSDTSEPLRTTANRKDIAATNANQPQSSLQKHMPINPSDSMSDRMVEKSASRNTPLSATGSEVQNETREHQESTPQEEHTVSHETHTKQIQTSKIEQTPLKKTFHNFAQEFQEKVESYKPPLMKVKMQLNPGNLGDVDVTLINRGQNLHVNINANPSTIAIFAQNQTEFKNALINMGFTGLQMQFGDNREQRGQNQRENQKQHQFSEHDTVETDHFDLIVPRYV